MECRQEDWNPDAEARDFREERITRLALCCRSGARHALEGLYEELKIEIHEFLGRHLLLRPELPVGLDVQDLFQQAYVELAEMALGWQPERLGSFLPYFRGSFRWRIGHYLRSQNPSRRSAHLRIVSVPHDALVRHAGDMAGLDGRSWGEVLALEELVRALPEPSREAVRLRIYEQLPASEVARRLGLSRSAAHRAFSRGLELLRSALAGAPDLAPARDLNREGGPSLSALRRCVEALHLLAPGGSPLPSRDVLRQAAGLTWQEYEAAMARLRSAGCIVGRQRGHSGSLAFANASDTMRQLEANSC